MKFPYATYHAYSTKGLEWATSWFHKHVNSPLNLGMTRDEVRAWVRACGKDSFLPKMLNARPRGLRAKSPPTFPPEK